MAATLGKNERLKSKKLIDRLFEEGNQTTSYPIKLVYLAVDAMEGAQTQAGFAVPKKNYKKAVHRNKIKRLMREAYRLQKEGFFNNSAVPYAFMFLYIGKEMPDFESIQKTMERLRKKLNFTKMEEHG